MMKKLERDVDGKIGIADFVKMVCHAKKPVKKKETPSYTDAGASNVDALTAKIPDKECATDDSNSNGCETVPVPGESDGIHGVSAADHAAQPARVQTPPPMIEGEDKNLPPRVPVVSDGANRSAVIASAGVVVNEEVVVNKAVVDNKEVVPDSTSVAIEAEEAGKSAVAVDEQEGPDSTPAKVLHYLCRSCRCTLFSERQLAHGQVCRHGDLVGTMHSFFGSRMPIRTSFCSLCHARVMALVFGSSMPN